MSITMKESLSIKDIEFVIDILIPDLNAGHYKGGLEALATQLIQINTHNKVYDGSDAKLFLLESGEEKLGFLVMLFKKALIRKNTAEIYMISIDNRYRNKGYGYKVLNMIENQFGTDAKLEARCLDGSVQMKKLLIKYGFKRHSYNYNGNTEKFIK